MDNLVLVCACVCVSFSNLYEQRVCGPTVDDTPAHFWPVASVAVVTVDGVKTAACLHNKQTNKQRH